MRKLASSNSLNKKILETNCGIAYTISVLSGRWKISILSFLLTHEKLRYSELKRKLESVSERMLIAQLKELESAGLIHRHSYPEVPPRVEYTLSEKGKTLETILNEMDSWGEANK